MYFYNGYWHCRGVKSTEMSRQAHTNETTRDWYRQRARRACEIISTVAGPEYDERLRLGLTSARTSGPHGAL